MYIVQHNVEIAQNMESWKKKPLLRRIYDDFYKEILKWVDKDARGKTVEIGSGMGNFKNVYPSAIATDIFPNPWIDQVESAYKLSFADKAVSNLVLFDVFHHLAYPGSALAEFNRVLDKGGRVILFEPHVSLLGLIVYGVFHHEPIAVMDEILWHNESGSDPDAEYYAAQGNATRIFRKNSAFMQRILENWNILKVKKYSAISYVLSGGFSKPALYPESALPVMRSLEKIFDLFPPIFATRMMVVLEKK